MKQTQLQDLLADMAVNLADKHGWTLTRATRYVLQLTEIARTEYRAAGAPYGDDEEGFARWLLTARGPITPSA